MGLPINLEIVVTAATRSDVVELREDRLALRKALDPHEEEEGRKKEEKEKERKKARRAGERPIPTVDASQIYGL